MLSRELISTLAKSGRIEILRTLKAYHDRQFTINELARTSGVPVMTTWRAVRELKAAGLLKTRRIGNSTAVWITDDPAKLRTLRTVPDTDPQKAAARAFAESLSAQPWLVECRLFGTVGRGDHRPGEEVDVAVVYDESVTEEQAKASSTEAAAALLGRTNVSVVPLCVSSKEMGRRGGLGSELRDKETIWERKRG
ncbi:MAG: Winged helix-turn-helix transcriptional regulator [Candidatus Thermoplasmatota archaeon]|nr:Winged helix-turn-helix transcriptional regulator [Candidatus Thermoplasmatota archaeon]